MAYLAIIKCFETYVTFNFYQLSKKKFRGSPCRPPPTPAPIPLNTALTWTVVGIQELLLPVIRRNLVVDIQRDEIACQAHELTGVDALHCNDCYLSDLIQVLCILLDSSYLSSN